MPDRSDNCQVCGANPHEACGMSKMSHDAIDCPRNASAWDSRMDDAKELRPGEMPMTVFRLSGDEMFESAWSVIKDDDAEMYVDDVKGFVDQGMEVMPAVMAVAKEVGVKGKDLMRAYTRRYK